MKEPPIAMKQRLKTAVERLFRPDRRRLVRPGSLERIENFHSGLLPTSRNILVYLPPNYDSRGETRYPVLYMQDGQNLFDPATSFIPGQHWRLRETADALIASRRITPLIIVGIENAGSERIHEYTPTLDVRRNAGGGAESYCRMLVDNVLPLINDRYRTSILPELTAVGGSSLGGLISLYAALRYPDVFGSAAVMSPAVWWDGRSILQSVESFDSPVRPRLWIDIGGREGAEAVRDARLLRDRLMAAGWRSPETLRYAEERNAEHTEQAWALRAPDVLRWLFGTERLRDGAAVDRAARRTLRR